MLDISKKYSYLRPSAEEDKNGRNRSWPQNYNEWPKFCDAVCNIDHKWWLKQAYLLRTWILLQSSALYLIKNGSISYYIHITQGRVDGLIVSNTTVSRPDSLTALREPSNAKLAVFFFLMVPRFGQLVQLSSGTCSSWPKDKCQSLESAASGLERMCMTRSKQVQA